MVDDDGVMVMIVHGDDGGDGMMVMMVVMG